MIERGSYFIQKVLHMERDWKGLVDQSQKFCFVSPRFALLSFKRHELLLAERV